MVRALGAHGQLRRFGLPTISALPPDNRHAGICAVMTVFVPATNVFGCLAQTQDRGNLLVNAAFSHRSMVKGALAWRRPRPADDGSSRSQSRCAPV
jgi:hypothetical protein